MELGPMQRQDVLEGADRFLRVLDPPRLVHGPVGAENSVTSCDLQILVYETTEAISS
jgi:hypothetical protein